MKTAADSVTAVVGLEEHLRAVGLPHADVARARAPRIRHYIYIQKMVMADGNGSW